MLKKLHSIAPDVSDCLLLIGVVAVFFGVYQLSIPYSYIVLGCIFIVMSLVRAYAEYKVALLPKQPVIE